MDFPLSADSKRQMPGRRGGPRAPRTAGACASGSAQVFPGQTKAHDVAFLDLSSWCHIDGPSASPDTPTPTLPQCARSSCCSFLWITSEGFLTFRKLCRTGLVYDTEGTQNCNYDFNVKGCNLKSAGIVCQKTEFSCPFSEACVPLEKHCNGHYDCLLGGESLAVL
ncbi:hypothetical protein QR680_012189 [Steinernema hermaphroditum]|uniref:Chitin-binding type-2 domain-containing protein n=1 Tax=Steinernema hermaphroditum TaxID=289476 RepID=A0AA39I3X5_9BILA|nr:hypothetical protein QR680_012189 [Steinernema hermaphroditum]